MSYRTIRGKILYTSLKEERMGQERGREFFSITEQADGVRVMHAHCEIDDAPMVARDVVLSVDKDYYPLDCHTRLSVDNRFEGSGWFRFTKNLAECETYNWRDGRISQKIDLEAPIRWLGTHPIVADGLTCKSFDLSQGPGKQHFKNMALTSPDHRGATGPMLFLLGYSLEYIGKETITVPAGEFECHRFRFGDTAGEMPEEHPVYDVWCEANDFFAVAAEAGGYMKTRYELTELTIEG